MSLQVDPLRASQPVSTLVSALWKPEQKSQLSQPYGLWGGEFVLLFIVIGYAAIENEYLETVSNYQWVNIFIDLLTDFYRGDLIPTI